MFPKASKCGTTTFEELELNIKVKKKFSHHVLEDHLLKFYRESNEKRVFTFKGVVIKAWKMKPVQFRD